MDLFDWTENSEDMESEFPIFRSMAMPARPSLMRDATVMDDAKMMRTDAPSERIKLLTVNKSENTASWAPIDQLRRLSYYRPIEHTHTIVPRARLERALTRLKEMFRQLSLQVVYENDGISALCISMEQVEFQVSFFLNRKNEQEVILEVQRLYGDSYTFHRQYACPLLAAVKNNGAPLLPKHSPRMSAESLDRLACLCGIPRNDARDDVESALECAANMIASERVDACLLGLESLVALTDPAKTGWHTAKIAAHALGTIAGCNNSPSARRIAPALWHLLWKSSTQDVNIMVLKTWGQVWHILAEQSPSDLNLSLEQTKDVAQALMQLVAAVHEAPHQATLALQCLQALMTVEPSLSSLIVWPVVETAHAVGCTQNAALEHASQQLLTAHA